MSSSGKNFGPTNPYIEDATLLDLEEIIRFLGNEAQLPKEGLPKKWASTQLKQMSTPLDPKSVEEILFINETHGGHAVTSSRLKEMEDSNLLSKDANGEMLAPCFISGDYVPVKSLEADHAHAKEDIFKRQLAVINRMNEDKDFAERILKQPQAKNFFLEDPASSGKYKGSKFFFAMYYNDIQNIWLICHSCNNSKNAKDFHDWIKNQWLYGKSFLDYLESEGVHNNTILQKIGDRNSKHGLAETAIKWFVTNQKKYLDNLKALQESIINPIQSHNQAGARAIAEGKQKKASKYFAKARAQLKLASNVTESLDDFMHETGSSASTHSSSEDEISQAAEKLSKKMGEQLISDFSKEYVDVISKKLEPKLSVQSSSSSSLALTSASNIAQVAQPAEEKILQQYNKLIREIAYGTSKKFTYNHDQNELIGTTFLPNSDSSKSFVEAIPSDVNSTIFQILEIDRKRAVKILAGLSSNQDAINRLSNVIKSALIDGRLQNSLYQKAMDKYNGIIDAINGVLLKEEIINASLDEHSLKNLLETNKNLEHYKKILDEGYKQKFEAIDQLGQSSEIFKLYISQFTKQNVRLDIDCAYLLAKDRQCNLFLWQDSTSTPGQLTCATFYYDPNNQINYHIRDVNNSNQFNLLIEKSAMLLLNQQSNNLETSSPASVPSIRETEKSKSNKRKQPTSSTIRQDINTSEQQIQTTPASSTSTARPYITRRSMNHRQPPSLIELARKTAEEKKSTSSIGHSSTFESSSSLMKKAKLEKSSSGTKDDTQANESDNDDMSNNIPRKPGF